MMDYSPMNNVQKGKKHPAYWVMGGLHNPHVAHIFFGTVANIAFAFISYLFLTYFLSFSYLCSLPRYRGPSKLTATLSHSNPKNEHPICMKLDLYQGHVSSSDRYKLYRELASDYSFLLDQLEVT